MRRSVGRVSGNWARLAIQTRPANRASSQKIIGQRANATTQPPTIGAMAGATPKIIETVDISRCAAAPSKQSRMIARPTIRPAPADIPCSARNTSNSPMLVDSAQPIEASTNAATPTRMTGRRPSASDTGPCNSDISA